MFSTLQPSRVPFAVYDSVCSPVTRTRPAVIPQTAAPALKIDLPQRFHKALPHVDVPQRAARNALRPRPRAAAARLRDAECTCQLHFRQRGRQTLLDRKVRPGVEHRIGCVEEWF